MSLLDDFDFNNNLDSVDYENQIEQDLIDIDSTIENLKSYDINNLNSKKIISNSNLTNSTLNEDLNVFIYIFGYIFRRLDYYKKVKCAFLFWILCCNYFSWLIVTDKNKIEKINYICYPTRKYNIIK
tara:strand:- start:1291 stop:1671 length:381 start_codon:yes stop_codon:yes gene_type:complete